MKSNNSTPTSRKLRSNSQSELTLTNIKNLIDASKNEIICSLRAEMQSLRESISSLSARVDKLEEENKTLKFQQQENLDQQTTEVTEPLSFEGTCSEIVDELQQRERRKLSLILAGAAEPESGTVAERRAFDKEQCRELFEAIGMSFCPITDVSRIGKLIEGRRRLLRVTVDNEENKRFLISNSKRLRHISKYRTVYLKPDLTLLQRKQNFLLRKELKTVKSFQPEKDFVIHQGKVVEKNSIQGFQKEF